MNGLQRRKSKQTVTFRPTKTAAEVLRKAERRLGPRSKSKLINSSLEVAFRPVLGLEPSEQAKAVVASLTATGKAQ